MKQVLKSVIVSFLSFLLEFSDILDQRLQGNWGRGEGSGQPFEEIHQKTRGKIRKSGS